jgi:uncharacterized protein (DUF433 family)
MELNISAELVAAVKEIAEKNGQDIESLVSEMVTEAIKMRRVPGIVFADGATGRRARIGGTGIEVFEVIDRYEMVDRDRLRLQELFDWLDPHQINMAIEFYEAYPDEIKKRLLTEEQEIDFAEALRAKFPHMRADWPGRRPGAHIPGGAPARETV